MPRGTATWTQSYLTIEQPNPAALLDSSLLELVGTPREVVDLSLIPDPSRSPMPSPDEAKAMRQQPWFATFMRHARGQPWEVAARDGIGPTEDRDSTMLRYVGGIVRRLIGPPLNGTPEMAFAALIDCVEQLDPNKGGVPRDWLAWTWAKIGWSWQRAAAEEAAKIPSNVEVARQEAEIQPDSNLLAEVARQVGAWLPVPELQEPNTEAAMLAVKRLAVVCVRNKNYHVLRRTDGRYSPVPLSLEHVRSELIRTGIGVAFQLERESKDGNMAPVGDRELLAQLMPLHIRNVEGEGGIPGDILRNVTRDSATYVRSLYQLRTDIVPEFSQDVHDLMLAQVGSDQIELYEAWIAHALDFSRGICMLALLGAPGIGKSLMGLGLADCLVDRSCGIASGQDLVTDFPPLLLRTPFIEIAEALPVSGFKAQARDTLRQLIGGSTYSVNVKGHPHVTIRSPLRVLVTTNNDSPIRQLSNDEASPDDVGAIMQRTLVIRLLPEAKAWLDARGGWALTARWVSAGGKQSSDWTLAKHFLWLYHNRDQYAHLRGKRFWIEGKGLGEGDEETEDLLSESESYIEVMGAVCDMLEVPNRESLKGLSLADDILVTADGVMDFMLRRRNNTRMTLRMVANQFNAFGSKRWRNVTKVCTNGTKLSATWWPIDAAKLLRFAANYGKPHNLLDVRVGMLKESVDALHPTV